MDHTDHDIELTRRSLTLAAAGVGLVSPNPLVGCVIVSPNGEVVGEGTYVYDQVTHAEALALKQAGERAQGATAYISLEPHSHHSKTAPCTEALINAGIRRVVCPIEDPNPLVSGRGFQALKDAEIEVLTGILSEQASRLNEAFICWHQKKRPFVHLKLATSIDGRISLSETVSTALSSDSALSRVQSLRHLHDAILIGGNTAAVDDPLLTDRSGKHRRRSLVRVVLDNRLRLSLRSRLVKSSKDVPLIIFTNSRESEKISALREQGVEVIESAMGGRDLTAVLEELKLRDIQSVLVEGGSEVAGSFCDERLVDKLTFIAAPIVIGGREAPSAIGGAGASNLSDAIQLSDINVERLGSDIEITGYPNS